MYSYFKFLVFFLLLIILIDFVASDSHSVQIGTDDYVNEVDTRFLSFTVDPKYLFTNTDSFNSKECICMASSLTPAFIRIAGPSTSHMTFHNSTITLNGQERDQPLTTQGGHTENSDLLLHNLKVGIENIVSRKRKREIKKLRVTHRQWKRFIQWANTTGFDLVFGLNYDDKTTSGMWDPNGALNILTVADKANVGDIYWQLGYECKNQTIEEYLNDLETLRVITETFKQGDQGQWKVISGDVTNCLQADSKSDFKDFVTLCDELMDAIFLNGNSSVYEINRLSERERDDLLRYLSKSTTPLWLTETTKTEENVKLLEEHLREEGEEEEERNVEDDKRLNRDDPQYQLVRAADWMTSLGYSARNGFSVHFRELEQSELFQPTLSFYMALLYKNLVGTRVLKVRTDGVVFAHCTHLRRARVPGAVTLYAANLRRSPARYAVKMGKREEGGDIMQFVLGMDTDSNIIVNGDVMQKDGDIKPVLKRVRPYKTLLLHLPPKSFGFWALANTNVEACHYDKIENKTQEFVEADDITDMTDEHYETLRKRRSLSDENLVGDVDEINLEKVDETNDIENSVLFNTLQSINKKLLRFSDKWSRDDKSNVMVLKRSQRQLFNKEDEDDIKMLKPKRRFKIKDGNKVIEVPKTKLGIVQKLKELHDKLNDTRQELRYEIRKKLNINKNNLNKRHVVHHRDFSKESKEIEKTLVRKRRNIITKTGKGKNLERDKSDLDNSTENEIDTEGDKTKISNLLRKLHEQLKHLPGNKEYAENGQENIDSDEDPHSSSDFLKDLEDEITVKTKLSDGKSIIKFSEKSNHGFITTGLENLSKVLEDLSSNLSRIWETLSMVA